MYFTICKDVLYYYVYILSRCTLLLRIYIYIRISHVFARTSSMSELYRCWSVQGSNYEILEVHVFEVSDANNKIPVLKPPNIALCHELW